MRLLALPFLLFVVSTWCTVAQTNNPIVIENSLAGTPSSQWDISGAGDTTIQGFGTDISVNQGGTIYFKIKTTASAYRIDIYRLGYYQGNGARYITTVMPSAHLPQSQPSPITDTNTGLMDYGNWAVSASWQVPTNATSGVYLAKLVRTDTGGASHIAFIVRNDSSTSAILFKTSDEAWVAYNDYGGNNLYGGSGPGGGLSGAGRAYKVSYNRPFNTRGDSSEDWLFNAEYPMIRWLEANGYDVSYSTSIDTARYGNLILQHRLFLSVGHDEYWSGIERTNVESARSAGVNLGFFSGNEIFWKTRWENSIDGSNTPYRTLVCYKETHAGAKIDPTPTWTGSWRDPRFSPPSDGGRPENALSGTIFMINGPVSDSIQVPAAYGSLRIWRNTSVASLAPGTTATFPTGTLGYEWDESLDYNSRPPGLIFLSSTVVSGDPVLQDYGSSYATGTATHNLTLYRAPSGALVFGAGTVQWSWGLDSNHDNGSAAPSTAMQQATVNLFADMGVQPATLQAGLVPATASSDHTPPTSTILTPSAGANVTYASPVLVTGTASDSGGGRVAGVEVSTDGGATWHLATGLTNWSYSWIPLQGGPATVQSRAIDDSCNVQSPAASVNVTAVSTPLSTWPSSAKPTVIDQGADNPAEMGVKFRSDVAGFITGIRFYKCSINIGAHIGDLWTSNGTHLASAPFTVETVSGWQQVNFTNPVPISSNTVYVASYHANNGHYSEDDFYFSTNGVDNSPLHLLADGVSGANGVFSYGSSSVFPSSAYNAANYWVDVAFMTTNAIQTLTNISVSPTNLTLITGGTQQYTATGLYSNGSPQNITSQVTWTSTNTAVATVNASGLVTAVAPGITAISASMGGVSGSTSLRVQTGPLSITTSSLPGGIQNTAYTTALAASGGTTPYTWAIISGSLPSGLNLNTNSGTISGTPNTIGTFNFTVQVSDASQPVQTATQPLSITITSLPSTMTIWPANSVPARPDDGADSAVELGVKFRSDVAGYITGVRFYKSSANTGTHLGDLWTSNGTLLATATFSGETASGWQQVNFSSPVAINANTVYVGSYHCTGGHYSEDDNYFASSGVDNPPLHALANGVSGPDGAYAYGAGSTFPNQGFMAANYWVDVVFAANLAPILPVQTNRVLNELTTLTVTNTATDNNPVSYTLTVTNLGTGLAVTNTSISTNGVITWTPGQTQSPSTNLFTTVVSDGTYSATNSFLVTVMEVNTAPVLPNQTNLTISGTTSIVVTNTATEPDIHAVTMGYGLNGPAGATIDTNGVIRWTPTVGQVPGVYPFTTVVTNNNPYDLVNPQLRATNSFTVTVNAIHNVPVLPVQTNRAVNELTLLVVTNTASANDVPSLPLTYSLTVTNLGTDLGVTNASIDTNGVISWTPTEVQGPSSNRVVTVVSDGTFSATNSFVVWVNEVNVAPVLPNQTDITISGLTPIVVTNTASDNDIPVNPLGYVLTGPAGSTIDADGIIRWTPTVGQVPGIYTFTTVVTDTNIYAVNSQDLSATNSFTVTVNAVHNAPVLPVQTNVTVNEMTLLVVTNSASANDVPALPLSYTLTVTNLVDGSVVTNASIDANGVINWAPTEEQGPSSNQLVTVVSDGTYSATNSFVVFVNEVNTAPVLPNQEDRTIDVLTPLVVTNTATDSDIPANTLTYVLAVAPTNAVIDTNGVITWTPLAEQGGTTNLFVTVVTDNGLPPLSATNSFEVMVNPAPVIPAPVIQSIVVSNDVAIVTWSSVSQGIYRLQYCEDLGGTNWTSVVPDVQATSSTTTVTNATGGSMQQFYRVMVVPLP